MGRCWVGLALLWLATGAFGETLRIGFGSHKPPYVFEGEPRLNPLCQSGLRATPTSAGRSSSALLPYSRVEPPWPQPSPPIQPLTA